MASDERFDELISTWLQDSAPAQIPQRVLEDAARRTRTSRQQIRWRARLGWFLVPRSVLAIGTTAAAVVAAILVLSPRLGQPTVGMLPTTPDAWTRVSIDSPWTTSGVDTLVAGPRGLLAFLGEGGSHAMQLSVSTDGRAWTLVPNEQFPSDTVLLPPSGSLRQAAVVTSDVYLFVADGNDVWASEDGASWERRADRARDEDLQAGNVLAVAVGGPGLIAVGSDNKAWYSEDGSDWTEADVPAPPTESFAALGLPSPTVSMQGVAADGDTYLAWGIASSSPYPGDGVQETVLWTSGDGKSWESVPDGPDLAPLRNVAAGPGGFVATDMNAITEPRAIRLSADGRSWETVASFESRLPSEDAGLVASVAGSSAGYVVVGGEGICAAGPCPDAVATIWTSPDGRSWSRLPGDDRFDPEPSVTDSGAVASSVVAWDSRFVVAGSYDASPVVWISGTPSATEAPVVTPVASSEPGAFLGVWVSTSDEDGGTQTMTVEPSVDDSVEIVVTDTIATVCSGTPSTMTGTGSVEGARLVIPAPDYRCDDGNEPQPMGGPGLNDELRDLTYTHDAVTDTLSVGIGDIWVRASTETPSPAPQPSEVVAPPSDPETDPSVASPISCCNGEVLLRALQPWAEHPGVSSGFALDGSRDERIELFEDPSIVVTGCEPRELPTDSASLAEAIRSNLDFDATDPVSVNIGGREALQLDAAAIVGWDDCEGDNTGRVLMPDEASARMRLYLVDAPEGSSIRILAIAVQAPEARFAQVLEAAAPIIDSIEFHAP